MKHACTEGVYQKLPIVVKLYNKVQIIINVYFPNIALFFRILAYCGTGKSYYNNRISFINCFYDKKILFRNNKSSIVMLLFEKYLPNFLCFLLEKIRYTFSNKKCDFLFFHESWNFTFFKKNKVYVWSQIVQMKINNNSS